MKTITIFISTGEDGRPIIQVVPSDGVEPQDGIQACRYGVRVFEEAAIGAEVERRIQERAEAEPLELRSTDKPVEEADG